MKTVTSLQRIAKPWVSAIFGLTMIGCVLALWTCGDKLAPHKEPLTI